MAFINTDEFSARLRARSLNPKTRQILVSRIAGSDQEADLSVPSNCGGIGRIRHFRRETSIGWPSNSLPIEPACASLGMSPPDVMNAQVFQNAACNWRCWYCYVPFELLAAKEELGEWVTAPDLIERFMALPDRPKIIDLSGGQPDLVPEWVVWMMEGLQASGLESSVYLWSDDNLSTDLYFRVLSDADRELVAHYPHYGRVCCFKGYNEESFSFNTRAAPELFSRQFEIFRSLLAEGLDLYCYATFTTPHTANLEGDMRHFMDRLQAISELLPLRLVPLEVQRFTPVESRLTTIHAEALHHQYAVVDAWQSEMEDRFSSGARGLPIVRVPLQSQ